MAMTRAAPNISAGDRKLAYRAAAPYRNGVVLLYLRIFSGHVAGWKNVREEKSFFVGKIRFKFQRADVRKWHPRVLRLPTCVAAHHM